MVGIYQDEFIEYLQDKLGTVKTTARNLIIPCPWCEFGEQKDHYHMYLSLEAPIFHCFHASCEKSGTIRKMLMALEGKDTSDQFIDKEVLENFKKKKTLFVDKDETLREVILPPLNPKAFPLKELYLDKRFKFANIPLNRVKGLIFDVYEFLHVNQIPITETLAFSKSLLILERL